MRFLLFLMMAALVGCGETSREPEATQEMETAADELQETLDATMQKAADVENKLQDAVEDLDAAIDEASGKN